MTREQFIALAGQLYDAQFAGNGGGRPPKYDTAISRAQGKVQYASECSLKELLYQKERFDKPPSDPKYLESNQKRSKQLGFWIAYRQTNPTDIWRGERNRQTVTAKPPSDRPEQYDREQTFAGNPAPASEAGAGDDDIPF